MLYITGYKQKPGVNFFRTKKSEITFRTYIYFEIYNIKQKHINQ